MTVEEIVIFMHCWGRGEGYYREFLVKVVTRIKGADNIHIQ